MEEKNSIMLFERHQVRSVWDSEKEKYWISIIDVIAILTDSDYQTARNYWKWLKTKLTEEGSEMVRNTNQLKLPAADGKKYLTDVADTEQILRLIQSIPSKKAEPFKIWLAEVGSQRIDEMADPELAIDRAVQNYRRLGYDEEWINERIKSIVVRKALTDEWKRTGIKENRDYAILTNIILKEWSGKNTKDYKSYKNLKKGNLRDNMTPNEIALSSLAETATTSISKVKNPKGMTENIDIAKRGGNVAKVAREQLEKELGSSAISPLNATDLTYNNIDTIGYDEDDTEGDEI